MTLDEWMDIARENAYREGYEKGYREGYEIGKKMALLKAQKLTSALVDAGREDELLPAFINREVYGALLAEFNIEVSEEELLTQVQ